MINYRCGCRNERHPTGALRAVHKCRAHAARRRDPATLSEAYYRELGSITDGAPAPHAAELVEALGELPVADPAAWALEIGPGPSLYLDMIRAADYRYAAIEPSVWAQDWLRARGAVILGSTLEEIDLTLYSGQFSLILAAHVLEHVGDAPRTLADLASLLRHNSEIRILVPDDSDLFNPDHLWFFKAESLARMVELAGLRPVALEVRKRVKHENFLYLKAVKP